MNDQIKTAVAEGLEAWLAKHYGTRPARAMYDIDRVAEVVTLAPSSIWAAISQGTFPKPVRVSAGRVAWYADEIRDWQDQRPRADAEADRRKKRQRKPGVPREGA